MGTLYTGSTTPSGNRFLVRDPVGVYNIVVSAGAQATVVTADADLILWQCGINQNTSFSLSSPSGTFFQYQFTIDGVQIAQQRYSLETAASTYGRFSTTQDFTFSPPVYVTTGQQVIFVPTNWGNVVPSRFNAYVYYTYASSLRTALPTS